MADTVLATRNLIVTFAVSRGLRSRKFNAVDDVTLDFRKGRVTMVVGESGAGKTTLGLATVGAVKYSGGRMLFNGQEVSKLRGKDYKEYRRNAQYIPQDPYASLHPFKRISTQMLEVIKLYNKHISDEEALEKAEKIFESVGLTPPGEILNKYPFEISGGQRQRINIAKVLAIGPSYVVADEPVTMLDASLKASLVTLMRDIIERTGMSLAFITHELSLAPAFIGMGDLAVMYLAKVVEYGPIETVLGSPLHPYTQALMSAILEPDPKRNANKTLKLTKLDPPNPLNPPPGCRFSDRCPFRMDKCVTKEPELKQVNAGHYVACYLY